MPGFTSIHIDSAITNMSLLYSNPAFIADRVAPILPVAKRSDKYFTYGKETALSVTALVGGLPISARAPGTAAGTIEYSVSTDNYYAAQYAYNHPIPDEELIYADDPLAPLVDAEIMLTNRLMLDNENVLATKVLTTANYSAANRTLLTTGAAGTTWANSNVNSVPMTNIQNGKLAVLKSLFTDPNRLMLTVDSAFALSQHTQFRDTFKYVSGMSLTNFDLPFMIMGLEVFIGNQQKITSAEGVAVQTTGNVWNSSTGNAAALVYYANENAGPRSVNAFRTFSCTAETNGGEFGTRKWYDPKIKATYVECAMSRDWKIVGKDGSSNIAGAYYIDGCTI